MSLAKRVNISSKRQITIPLVFFKELGFTNEAECEVRNGAMVIRPVRQEPSGAFDEEILKDLVSQGLQGEERLKAFHEMREMIRPAVLKMIEEADEAALGKGEFYTHEEVFSEDD